MPITILYDGNCPICCRKKDFLKRRDHRDILHFADIRDPDFQASRTGVSIAQLEKQIHAILPDGSLVSRMDVIREAYRAIDLYWLIAPTDWPILRTLFDWLYDFVAKYRMLISRFFR